MDLGIAGKRALVCAASRGLGLGCAAALAEAGVELVINARRSDVLEAAATELRTRYGATVTAVAADITDPAGRAAVLEAAGSPDILVTNAGGPPPGVWQDWQREDYLKALEANLLTPIALITTLLPPMMERGWGRIVNITSGSVKAPIPALGLSNMARTGLTGFVAGTARQVASSGVTINNLLPGSHDTDRIAQLTAAGAAREGVSVEEFRRQREAAIPVGRYGTAAEFGATCAFLCSQHAGFIVGQNILLDGGAISATI